MNVGRLFSWTVLAGMAIAGGLFVSDQRVLPSSRFHAPPIPFGIPLRLGIVLSDTPGTMGMNQTMTHTLLLARDRVNQCGGINQTPVFLEMLHGREDPSSPDEATHTQAQQPTDSTTAIAQEAQDMNWLIQSQDIHGAIAAFTPAPNSHGLISEALDTAIDFNVPTISPTNTQPLLVGPDNSPFDRFRREFSKGDTRPQGDRRPPSTNDIQLQAKKTKYWSRTIMSDRQYLMMVAQLAHEQGWKRIATLGPDTDRGDYLEQLLSDTLEAWNGPSILPEDSLHYSVSLAPDVNSPGVNSPDVTSSDVTSGEITSLEVPLDTISQENSTDSSSPESNKSTPTTVEVALNTESLATQPPDAIIVFLEPGMFSDLLIPAVPPSPHSSEAPEDAGDSGEMNTTSSQERNLSPSPPPLNALAPAATSEATLAPISGTIPQATLTNMSDPLPPIATALAHQLRTVIDLEQTPVILGNWLDIDILLAQVDAMKAIAPPHDLAGLRGILSRPSLSLYQVLPKIQHSRESHLSLPLKSAIVHSTWDAAVLMMLAAEAAGYNHKDAIQNNLRNVANPPGTEITDVCEALALIRQGEAINYQGISGRVDLNGWGDVNPPQTYKVWQITPTGDQKTIKTLEWLEPSSSSTP